LIALHGALTAAEPRRNSARPMKPRSIQADVAIAGGGMVGLTLAIALAQGGMKVAVADPMTAEQFLEERFDGRVSALAFASVRMLRALKLWDALLPDAQPINDIVVSDGELGRQAAPFSLHFDHREIGEILGYIVENRHIRRALLDGVTANRVAFLSGVSVGALEVHDGGTVLALSDGGTIESPLTVAAEGRESALREGQGIRSVAWDYPQIGIVTTVEHERPHNGVAYEHFLPTGPFAILPMTGRRSSLVWTEQTREGERLLKLDDAPFTSELRLRFGAHLGDVRPVGPRWSYPLRLHLARSYAKHRFALVGDAAHTIHPIAGQGLNLGLKDVAALAETVLDAKRLGLDFGRSDVLERYERWRRFDSLVLAATTDGLNRVMSNNLLPLRLATCCRCALRGISVWVRSI
jgi:2-octaprenyl-6-methoxyphenol hydroxylase